MVFINLFTAGPYLAQKPPYSVRAVEEMLGRMTIPASSDADDGGEYRELLSLSSISRAQPYDRSFTYYSQGRPSAKLPASAYFAI
jgi:hypothetical protein